MKKKTENASSTTAKPKRDTAQSKSVSRPSVVRRMNRYHWFAVHVIVYIIGSTLIWALPASIPYKQFDTLVWLALVGAHGLLVFRQPRATLILHTLMFAAGNGAIWTSDIPMPIRILVSIGWLLTGGGIAVMLYRRMLIAQGRWYQVPDTEPLKLRPIKEPIVEPDIEEPVYEEAAPPEDYPEDYEEYYNGRKKPQNYNAVDPDDTQPKPPGEIKPPKKKTPRKKKEE